MKNTWTRLGLIALLLLSLFTACTNQPPAEADNTTVPTQDTETTAPEEPPTTQAVATTVPQEPTTEVHTETVPVPSVPNDLDYYSMYQESMERHKNVTDGELQTRGEQYAKKWTSTDGKISFVLDFLYGPFSYVYIDDAAYTVDGVAYKTEIEMAPYYFKMYISRWDSYTIILQGNYKYNHDEQSFTVTAAGSSLTANLDDTLPLTIEEQNEKYGDADVPIYQGGEHVTFQMVR